ncbi:MAG: MBL fold metallo-hydrolase [Candidatus Scalindua sp. AMX11]|nr:MAG: MBL fold metallo-hydrolase [Candidatus Scalindua sp.]NOG84798.1 MBL fold metallo-hydrolase [Planctomycetota bacterium]RZV98398.1 MAG: MBL fold metallo-hydrolase [Candidatus Scalindua sp. SCAELEC01]TDE66618.1 MAG: MBL fold metallo-hydrolase [Candidatus Scalindua sp. AMX11]
MKIGKYELHQIETGIFGLDGGAMFGIVPRSLWSKLSSPDEENRIDMALRALLIMGDNRAILVDTGVGNKFTEKQKRIYRIDQEKENLTASLQRFNLETEDITDVILTHLHFDHAGGATSIEEGEHVLTFPNATYYVQKKNYEWALNPSDKDRGSYLKENFVPLAESEKLQLVEGEGEILPGIEVLVSNGHTIGQQLVKLSDDKQTLVYCADLIPMASHIKVPYITGYDIYPLKTIEEKKSLLSKASSNGWILFLEHDAKSAAVKIEKSEIGFTVRETICL